MAFKLPTAAERDAAAAMTPFERKVLSAKDAFVRLAPAIAKDEDLRAQNSVERKVIRLGGHIEAYFGASVQDWDGNRRSATLLMAPFREDGAKITFENVKETSAALYWTARADKEDYRSNHSLPPHVDLGEMAEGSKVSLLGKTVDVPAVGDRAGRVEFRATRVAAGEHSLEAMQALPRGETAEAAVRYMAADNDRDRDAIAQAYAHAVISREFATGLMGQAAEVAASAAPSRDGGYAKGPSQDAPVLQGTGKTGQGR